MTNRNRYFVMVLIALFYFSGQKAQAQVVDQTISNYEKNKIQIFTVEERGNLYDWFESRIDKMHLPEKIKEEYYSIILYYNVKMSRLDDKDKKYTKKQVLKRMDKYIARQNAEVKEILTPEQYKMHLENYDRLLKSVRRRIEETDKIKE
jgi:hypothetical protein